MNMMVAGETIVAGRIKPVQNFIIDFNKIETREDMKAVMSAHSIYVSNYHPEFEKLKPFLREY